MRFDPLETFGILDGHAATAIGDRWIIGTGAPIPARSPIDGRALATIAGATVADVDAAVDAAHAAFLEFRTIPAPIRGELVRRIGAKLRERKADLADLVTLEAGKITSESLGEVQEMIDVCDFAVGLSRQLHGLTIASERPGHRMMEQWHPLGVVGVISAFNFPVAVWAWNAMLGLVCGDAIVWKPSEKTPLTAIATHKIACEAIRESTDLNIPEDVVSLVIGGREAGERLAASHKVALLSATGSTRMGKHVAQVVAARLGRSLLELGGNNAMIVAPSADLEMATRAITFSAFGTAGQRCTTLRRLIVHGDVYDKLIPRVKAIASKLKVGDPREAGTLLGPLIDRAAFDAMQEALGRARAGGATAEGGTRVSPAPAPRRDPTAPAGPGDTGASGASGASGAESFYVTPAFVEHLDPGSPIVRHETFAPILYCFRYESIETAFGLQNDVPQGLSSAIFTNDVREAERFLAASGSDCGIANVNIGTSGAEIGGAFGGEKETGGGRESGSDAWRAYMRRATNTINYSRDLPLAQGVSFDADEPGPAA